MPTDDKFSKFLEGQKDKTSSGDNLKQENKDLEKEVSRLRKEISHLQNRIEELKAENHRKKVKIIKLNKKLSGDVGRR